MSRAGIAPLLALALLAAACERGGGEAKVEFRPPVSVREIVGQTVEDRIVATGTLRAPETATLTVPIEGQLTVARAGGRRLAEGDRVAPGQLVATITGEDVRVAARTEASQVRYEQADRDLESRRALFREGLVTELEVRAAETALAEARAELDRSRYTENRTALSSPIAGILLKLARDTQGLPLPDGQRVLPGTVVAQIGRTQQLVADVDVVGPDALRVAVGLPVRLRHHAWEGKTFEGRVARLAPSLDPATRTFRVEIEVENSAQLLRPGMFVEATIVVDTHRDVPVVPREAVVDRDGRTVVFTVEAQRAARREVGLGLGDDEVVEVREGVKIGERVVVQGHETLTDGQAVRVGGL
ncbi:MAG: efflux RND transporter periplasmic adaptor subunit [Acidobacteria bacterium]|nr:efflux RND transporter periplasmic adaptor subunit [Acidobacteriota bacterium]